MEPNGVCEAAHTRQQYAAHCYECYDYVMINDAYVCFLYCLSSHFSFLNAIRTFNTYVQFGYTKEEKKIPCGARLHTYWGVITLFNEQDKKQARALTHKTIKSELWCMNRPIQICYNRVCWSPHIAWICINFISTLFIPLCPQGSWDDHAVRPLWSFIIFGKSLSHRWDSITPSLLWVDVISWQHNSRQAIHRWRIADRSERKTRSKLCTILKN